MDDNDCDAAIISAVAIVTHVHSLSQEVGSGDEGLYLYGFYLSSSAETDPAWSLEEEEQERRRNQSRPCGLTPTQPT